MNAVAEDFTGFRPCLILAHADPAYAAQVVRAFRRHGWDVYPAQNGPEVRRLARMLEPQLVVLQTDLPEESGWLTCDKLTDEWPDCKVVLVSAEPTPLPRRLRLLRRRRRPRGPQRRPGRPARPRPRTGPAGGRLSRLP